MNAHVAEAYVSMMWRRGSFSVLLNVVCRSGEESVVVGAGRSQSGVEKPSRRSDDDVSPALPTGVIMALPTDISTVPPTGVSTSRQVVSEDLAQRLQRAVRAEMRCIMEVCNTIS